MADSSTSFQYALIDIAVKRFCFESIDDKKWIIDALPITFQISFRFDPDSEKIFLFMVAKVCTPQDETIVAELAVEYTFSVKGLGSLEKENDLIKIPQPFLLNLINIGYGTLRGIFHERVANTALSRVILPILNVQDLINKGVEK